MTKPSFKLDLPQIKEVEEFPCLVAEYCTTKGLKKSHALAFTSTMNREIGRIELLRRDWDEKYNSYRARPVG